ncbi:MAG: phage head closure protein [Methyloligellaceae bacterium]
MPQNIKQIRHRIALQALILTDDGFGGQTRSWQQIATLWASLRPKSTREYSKETINAEQLQSTIIYEITIRHRTDITPQMRIIFGSRKFNILSAFDKDGYKEWLICICEEIKS